jgi:hypothetical protein
VFVSDLVQRLESQLLPAVSQILRHVGGRSLGLLELHCHGPAAHVVLDIVRQLAERNLSVVVTDFLNKVVSKEAVSLFLAALSSLVALSSREHHELTVAQSSLLGSDFGAAQSLVHAFIVTVDAAEAGVEEDGSLVEVKVADACIEVVEGDAVRRLCAADVGGQQVSLVRVVDVRHTVTGIVDDELQKPQTPTTNVTENLTDSWKQLRF